ncbi:MAG TPA: hypothetical protein VIQ01_02560 [Burkholderiales bacterium]|jgi:hypothetical protein
MDDTLHYQAQLPIAASHGTKNGASGQLALSIENGQMILALGNEHGETTRFHLDKQAALDFHEGLERSMFFLQYIN